MSKILILMLASAVASQADVVTNLAAFLAETGPNSVATFDDVAVGTTGTFTSGGATFSGGTGGEVLNSLVGLDHAFWFGAAGSAPNFFGPTLDYNVAFPSEVSAFGVLMSCFGCDVVPNDSLIAWTLYSALGTSVATGSQVVNLSPSSEGNPSFLGVISSVPFSSVAITKTDESTGQPGGTYVIDDFRSVPSVPEPSSVFLLGAATGVLFWVAGHKRRAPRF